MPIRRSRPTDGQAEFHRAFDRVLAFVEEAKAVLVSAVPAGRAPGRPVADALAAFDERLRAARDRMPSWRAAETETQWRACDLGLAEALRRSERLRLEAPALDYEGLVMTLGRLIEPLEPFEEASEALSG